MPKISTRKLTICELHCLNFKHKNNIKRKRLGCGKFLWKETQKEFHVLIKELKLFDHKYLFKHIATHKFDFPQ